MSDEHSQISVPDTIFISHTGERFSCNIDTKTKEIIITRNDEIKLFIWQIIDCYSV